VTVAQLIEKLRAYPDYYEVRTEPIGCEFCGNEGYEIKSATIDAGGYVELQL
jgi:hypothetical protein